VRRRLPLHAAYRATGADLPFGDPLPYHGVAMEGYYWRFTDPARGRVVIALIGVNRDRRGEPWATLGLGSHPNAFLETTAHPEAGADPERMGAFAGSAFAGRADSLRVDLGPRARLDVRIEEPVPWPRRLFGGSSVFHVVPALNQYWHPWLLGGRVRGSASLGEEEWDLDGATAYCEKNWGRGGFPPAWWWGQAQGFAEPAVCVAFAGGIIEAGPLRREVSAIVVRLPDGRVIRVGDPASPVSASVTDETWSLRGRGPRWSVEVEGWAPLGRAHVLPVPLPHERRNVPGALEHLGGTMRAVVRRRGRVVWAGDSPLAALEHGGIDRARAEAERRGAGPDATHAAPER